MIYDNALESFLQSTFTMLNGLNGSVFFYFFNLIALLGIDSLRTAKADVLIPFSYSCLLVLFLSSPFPSTQYLRLLQL